MSRSNLTVICIVSLALIAVYAVPIGANGYDMSITDTVDSPPEEIELEGSTYEVSEVIERDPGESITADVSVPADDQFQVYLYNTDQQEEVSSDRLVGSETVTLGTAGLEPGTYLLALYSYSEGDYVDIYPVVMSGYELAIDAPAEATATEDITITVDVAAEAASSQPASVDIGIWNGETIIDASADHQGGSKYEATVALNNVEEGEFQVYAVTRNGEAIDGYPVSHGISGGDSLTITAPDDEDSGDSNESDETNGEEDGGNVDDGNSDDEDGGDDDSTTGDDSDGSTGDESSSNETDEDGTQDSTTGHNESSNESDTDGDSDGTDEDGERGEDGETNEEGMNETENSSDNTVNESDANDGDEDGVTDNKTPGETDQNGTADGAETDNESDDTNTDSSAANESDSQVIEPNASTGPDSESNSSGEELGFPILGILAPLIALVVTALVLMNQRNSGET